VSLLSLFLLLLFFPFPLVGELLKWGRREGREKKGKEDSGGREREERERRKRRKRKRRKRKKKNYVE